MVHQRTRRILDSRVRLLRRHRREDVCWLPPSSSAHFKLTLAPFLPCDSDPNTFFDASKPMETINRQLIRANMNYAEVHLLARRSFFQFSQ